MATTTLRRYSTFLLWMCCLALTSGAKPATPSVLGSYEGYMGQFTLAPREGKIHLDFPIGIPGCTGSWREARHLAEGTLEVALVAETVVEGDGGEGGVRRG